MVEGIVGIIKLFYEIGQFIVNLVGVLAEVLSGDFKGTAEAWKYAKDSWDTPGLAATRCSVRCNDFIVWRRRKTAGHIKH